VTGLLAVTVTPPALDEVSSVPTALITNAPLLTICTLSPDVLRNARLVTCVSRALVLPIPPDAVSAALVARMLFKPPLLSMIAPVELSVTVPPAALTRFRFICESSAIVTFVPVAERLPKFVVPTWLPNVIVVPLKLALPVTERLPLSAIGPDAEITRFPPTVQLPKSMPPASVKLTFAAVAVMTTVPKLFPALLRLMAVPEPWLFRVVRPLTVTGPVWSMVSAVRDRFFPAAKANPAPVWRWISSVVAPRPSTVRPAAKLLPTPCTLKMSWSALSPLMVRVPVIVRINVLSRPPLKETSVSVPPETATVVVTGPAIVFPGSTLIV